MNLHQGETKLCRFNVVLISEVENRMRAGAAVKMF